MRALAITSTLVLLVCAASAQARSPSNAAPRISDASFELRGHGSARTLELRVRICDDAPGGSRRGDLVLVHMHDLGDGESFSVREAHPLAFRGPGCWWHTETRRVPKLHIWYSQENRGCHVIKLAVHDPAGRRSNTIAHTARCGSD